MNPGIAIAHYRITAKLGSGGMGEVWRATDTRLNRDVAIKILPEAFAADPDRLARFKREAQVLASLNHANIAQIYAVEERAIVMELVEGSAPAGPLSADAALPLIHQLIDALEYAHEKGVVHRDLKPANIRITPEGRLKVLDFGLAKALSSEPAPSSNPASSPTLTMQGTVAGVLLGTAAYMSPEQARGHTVDKRADIWAFGVVLFEMLTGEQLFTGQTVSDTLAAVLRQDPDLSAVPPRFQRLLRLCLARDPRRRLRDIGDARLVIDEPGEARSEAALPAAPRNRLRWLLAGAGLAALAGLAFGIVHFRETPAEAPLTRLEISLPEKTHFGIGSRLAVSPDGRKLAFNAVGADGRFRLYVRPLDSLETRPLPGTEGASCAFWSPDGRWIAFWADGKLKKIEAGGPAGAGPTQTLGSVTDPISGGAWSRDGVILFGGLNARQPLRRISQAGGDVVPATALDVAGREAAHGFPQFLPDGRRFLYFLFSAIGDNAVYVATLDGKERKRLLATDAQARYVPPATKNGEGRLLFSREGTLMAQTFDPNSLSLLGEAMPVADRVWSYRTFGFFTATNGLLAYRAGTQESAADGRLTWFDREGKSLGDLGPPAPFFDLALSPDGKRVAASEEVQPGRRDIWLIDTARNAPTRFTFDTGSNQSLVWAPDGSRLVFASRRDHPGLDLYQKDSGGVKIEQPLFKSDLLNFPNDWSADGRYVIYTAVDPANNMDLWVLPMTGEGKPEPFRKTRFNESQGQFSPGTAAGQRWVAFSSDESGRWQVYVQPFPGGPSASKFQVSTGIGGTQPRWRADGKELYYFGEDEKLMAVEVKLSPEFQAGVPRALFTTRIRGGAAAARAIFRYAVAPDGKRFLVNTEQDAEQNAAANITVVQNWEAGLGK